MRVDGWEHSKNPASVRMRGWKNLRSELRGAHRADAGRAGRCVREGATTDTADTQRRAVELARGNYVHRDGGQDGITLDTVAHGELIVAGLPLDERVAGPLALGGLVDAEELDDAVAMVNGVAAGRNVHRARAQHLGNRNGLIFLPSAADGCDVTLLGADPDVRNVDLVVVALAVATLHVDSVYSVGLSWYGTNLSPTSIVRKDFLKNSATNISFAGLTIKSPSLGLGALPAPGTCSLSQGTRAWQETFGKTFLRARA